MAHYCYFLIKLQFLILILLTFTTKSILGYINHRADNTGQTDKCEYTETRLENQMHLPKVTIHKKHKYPRSSCSSGSRDTQKTQSSWVQTQ